MAMNIPTEHVEKLVEWDFTPIVTPRKTRIPQMAYAACFKRAMDGLVLSEFEISNRTEEHPFLNIFDALYQFNPNERDARVAASFMAWLGTESGISFLKEAEHLKDKFNYASSDRDMMAFTAAWALENIPSPMFDKGRTARDYILGDKAIATQREILVMEACARWLGWGEGQQFLKKVRTSIKLREAAARRRPMMTHMGVDIRHGLGTPSAPIGPVLG